MKRIVLALWANIPIFPIIFGASGIWFLMGILLTIALMDTSDGTRGYGFLDAIKIAFFYGWIK